jgi:hypothetical protein
MKKSRNQNSRGTVPLTFLTVSVQVHFLNCRIRSDERLGHVFLLYQEI